MDVFLDQNNITMAKISIIYDTSRKRKKGSPIYLVLSHQSQSVRINTGIIIKPENWNDKKKLIKGKSKDFENAARVNNHLIFQKADLIKFIDDLSLKTELNLLTALQIKKKYESRFEKTDFYTYANRLIENLKKAGKIGNASIYSGAVRYLQNNTKSKTLKFSDINYSFLVKLENKHIAAGYNYNGLSVYLRTIRAILNQAIKEGIYDRKFYPFDSYKIKQERTKKQALTIEQIKKIEQTVIDKNSTLFHVQQMFLFSFYAIGMNPIDIVFLKISNIQNERIEYKRAKTHRNFSIKITDKIQNILDYYIENKNEDDYIFPFMPNRPMSIEDRYNKYRAIKENLNKRIRTLRKLTNISELTFYSARHTWASLANTKKIPITAISQSLGHADIKTTQIYLKSLANEIIDDYNKDITNFE